MSALSTGFQVGQGAGTHLHAPNLFNEFALQGCSLFNRGYGAQLNDDAICTHFGQLLFAQPVSATVVSGVASPFVLGESNVKGCTVGIFPDVDVHGVLLINDR
jgi:hypothetical protein